MENLENIPLELATVDQISQELSQRPNLEFCLVMQAEDKSWKYGMNSGENILGMLRALSKMQANILDYLAYREKFER